jgi:hypothetical protein
MGNMEQAPNLYDHEIRQIGKIWHQLQEKYRLKPNTPANLDSLESEAKHRFFEAGFRVELEFDINEGYPQPILEIVGRVNPAPAFDYEKKVWEVQKSREKGGV